MNGISPPTARNIGTKAPARIVVHPPRAGFSLIELLVVLSITGVLLTIVVPRIDVSRFQLDAAIQEVTSTVAAARGQSVLRQHDFVLTFDEPEDRLYVLYDANNNGETDEGEQRRTVQLSESVKFARGGAPAISGMTDAISFTKVSEELPALTFHRNGSGSEEGILYLTSARAIGTSTYPQDARALRVVRSTGRVRCYSYRTLSWLEGC